MAVNRKNMDQKQGRAIVALLETSTIAQAAKRAGISERTLLRWRKQDHSQTAFGAARHKLVSQAIARLQQEAGEAVDTLHAVMKGSAPANAKVAAARLILDWAFKGAEIEDLEERMNDLEQRFEEVKGKLLEAKELKLL